QPAPAPHDAQANRRGLFPPRQLLVPASTTTLSACCRDFFTPSGPLTFGLFLCILNAVDYYIWCAELVYPERTRRARAFLMPLFPFASPKQPKSHPLESVSYEMQIL